MKLLNPIKVGVSLGLLILATACVKYEKGAYKPVTQFKASSIPPITFQSKVFLIEPPKVAQIGESMDPESQQARAKGIQILGCAQFGRLNWKPQLPSGGIKAVRNLPKDLQDELDKSLDKKSENPKLKRRIKVSQNEFSLQKSDLSMYENNPDPLDVIESLNIFSSEVLPRKITGDTSLGATPQMLLQFAKTIYDDSNTKITSVTTFRKTPGAFVATNPTSVRDNVCNAKVVDATLYGAAISVAISIRFQTPSDKKAFQDAFGADNPFVTTNPEFTDLAMSAQLTAAKASVEIDVGQIGGDVAKTKSFMTQISCGIDKLEKCRVGRRDLIENFFKTELKPPVSPQEANGWVPVDIRTISLSSKK